MSGLRARTLAAGAIALAIAACDPGTRRLGWEIELADPALAARAVIVEGRILAGGCSSTDVVFADEASRGETPEAPPALAAGRYGFEGRARDADCVVFATGCVESDVPIDEGATILVTLDGATEAPACASSECSAGVCGGARDASIDAPLDGGVGDAALDAPAECGSDGDCGECMQCTDGMCEPASDGAACAGGTCHDAACCTGCWNGASCELGDSTTACGSGGIACEVCRDATPFCTDACVGPRPIATLASAAHSACAIASDGTLWCWGANDVGQVGNGMAGPMLDEPTPVRVGTRADWASVGAGDSHVCAVDALGAMSCWGDDMDGQLGVGDLANRTMPTPVTRMSAWGEVRGGTGGDHTCALTGTELWCAGQNDYGQLGLGDLADRTALTRSGADWTAVALGHHHSCAITPAGSLWCWGENLNGQLGIAVAGATEGRTTAVRVGTASDWTAIAAGDQHTCGIRAGGQLWCWGADADGQLGDGMTTLRSAPQRVGTATDWLHVSLGAAHTCAVRTDGTLWCWGRNDAGQLGLGSVGSDVRTPSRAGTATDWEAVSAGELFTCGLRAGGRLLCWGSNAAGQLGQGDHTTRTAPTEISIPPE